MQLPFKINTVEKTSEALLKEKGSEFSSYSYPIKTEVEANDLLNSLRKKFYDATHHCYAFKLADGTIKYSDDGEPGGTAGIRILNAINHFDLNNIIVIVVRYFGGTKLGVGPLGKAYYESALECLKQSKIISQFQKQNMSVKFPFEQSNFVHKILTRYSVKILRTDYTDSPGITCTVKIESSDKLITELTTNPSIGIKVNFVDESTFYEI
ncbi:MAG: YigZ family protein [Ignavibacteriales bacterium]|nr:YigZ family protein [Ignavibacteriales bacterium]